MNPTNLDTPRIPGEYDHVARRSADADALKLAHATSITREGAVALLNTLAERAGVKNLEIKWGTRRGRGGLKAKYSFEKRPAKRYVYVEGKLTLVDGFRRRKVYARNEAGAVVVNPYVSLPTQPMGDGEWWVHAHRDANGKLVRGGSRLRVGLVLHEFAHVMCPRASHGEAFVKMLDALVYDWLNSVTTPEVK